MKQAYDEKNKQDYDNNTHVLYDALDEIEKNRNLPATQAQLSKMTGIHRNTISERGFPKVRLNEIKELRKKLDSEEKREKRAIVDELQHERDNMAKELVYWFSEYRIANRDRNDFECQIDRLIEEREFYRKVYQAEKEKVKQLETEKETLKELLRDLK